MKRFIFILFISLLFCGCSFFSSLFGSKDEEVEKTVKVNSNGDVYLVKLNNSNKIIKGNNTGYVTSVSRSAVDDSEFYNTDSFVRDLNKKVNDFLIQQTSSRAADLAIKDDFNVLTDNIGDEHDFYVLVAENTFQSVPCVCKYVTDHCIIYADKANSTLFGIENCIPDSVYKAIGDSFESCYEKEINIIGSPIYKSYLSDYCVPCTSKITIVVSDLFRDGKQKGNSGTIGYNYSGDFFKKSVMENSNQREVFYLDAAFLAEDNNIIFTTSVHEFNHLINFVIKTINPMTTKKISPNKVQTCDTWFTEMLSMTTEDMFQSCLKLDDMYSPKSRLAYFGFGYYYGFKSWENKNVEPLISYANTYAFGAFLARNFGGVELIKQIAQNDYVNEQAITKALQTIYPNETYTDEKTQETKPIDYTYALRKFTMCIVNTGADNSFSLNRGTGFKNGLGFTPINLVMDITYDGSNYTLPLTFKKDAKLDLYPSGFSVHYIGTNIKSFKLNASTNEELEYYLIQ